MIFRNTILVSADKEQKQSVTVNGMTFQIVPRRWTYEPNQRETAPVVSTVIDVGEGVPLSKGDVIVLHHNSLLDEIYEINGNSIVPFDRWVLAKVNQDGWLEPMNGNIICENMMRPEFIGEFAAPETAQVYYQDRVKADDGRILGIRKWSNYEVVWHWNGEVRRKVVLWEEDSVCEIFKSREQAAIIISGRENYKMWEELMR